MIDRGLQIYRIAAATGTDLRGYSTDQWHNLLAVANLQGVDPRSVAVRSLLEEADRLGVSLEAQLVLMKVADEGDSTV
jgi:hypothetical protein